MVDEASLGKDPARDAKKKLIVRYDIAGQKKTDAFEDLQVVYLAPNESAAAAGPGLTLLEAKYGAGKVWIDVLERLRPLVKENSLAVQAHLAAEGDPLPGRRKFLFVRYVANEIAAHAIAPDYSEIRIDARDPMASQGVAATQDNPGAMPKPMDEPNQAARPRSLGELAKDDYAADTEKPSAKLVAKEAFTLPQQHTDAITRVTFHPTLALLASAGKDGKALLWNLEQKALASQIEKFDKEAWTVKFSPAGDLVASASRHWWAAQLVMKNIKTGVEIKRLKDFKDGGGAVGSVAFTPDGAFFAAGQDDGTIRLWDTATSQELLPVSAGGSVMSLTCAASYDRKRKPTKYVLAAACHDNSFRTFDLTHVKDKSGERWTFASSNLAIPKQERAICARFSPDAKLLAGARERGAISFFDPASGQLVHKEIRVSDADVRWLAFHPQRPWIVAAHAQDQLARIWNYQTNELLCELKGHDGEVNCAEFSRDGLHVATASADMSIRIWDLAGADLPAAPKKGKKSKPAPAIVGD